MKIENVSVRDWRNPPRERRERFFVEAAKAVRRQLWVPAGPLTREEARDLLKDLPTRDAYWYTRSLLRQHGLGFEEPGPKEPRAAWAAYQEAAVEAAEKALKTERWLARWTVGEQRDAHATLAAFLQRLLERLRTPQAA